MHIIHEVGVCCPLFRNRRTRSGPILRGNGPRMCRAARWKPQP